MCKNILITGAAGFIGSAVTIHITNKYPEYNVVAIDKISYCSSLKNIKECLDSKNFTFEKVDITDIESLNKIFGKYNIDTVLHFAAYTHVDHSFANSILFTENNVLGTHNLLEVSKEHHIERFVHVSTDEVYGDVEGVSTERSLLAPTNPYAATKAAAEHLVMAYHISFGLNVVITRGNNVYGPKQFPEKVIPKFIGLLTDGKKLTIQGTGEQRRSFLYISDVVEAFDVILHRAKVGEVYNIGTPIEYSINTLAHKLLKIMKVDSFFDVCVEYVRDRDFNDMRYSISTNKLKDLGWKQKVSFDEGLKRTVRWYCRNKGYFDTTSLS